MPATTQTQDEALAALDTPLGRLKAWALFQFADHGFLRVLWTNLFEIAPGVWRSNQPSPARLARYKRMGVTSVLSLRGDGSKPFHVLEKSACQKLGLTLHTVPLSARKLREAEHFLDLFDLFERIEKPFVLHCKSGADRAGLVSALWLMHMEGRPVQEAREMLSFKYLHLKSTHTGILDHLLDIYEADTAQNPMPIRQWFETCYDPAKITASFTPKYRFN